MFAFKNFLKFLKKSYYWCRSFFLSILHHFNLLIALFDFKLMIFNLDGHFLYHLSLAHNYLFLLLYLLRLFNIRLSQISHFFNEVRQAIMIKVFLSFHLFAACFATNNKLHADIIMPSFFFYWKF